jgi:tRNA (guanine-N7-)-methyltransferase
MVPAKSDPSLDLFHKGHSSVRHAADTESLLRSVEFVPANYFAPIDLAEVFPRPGLVELDLGCGDGSFLVAKSQSDPGRNYLGIERMFGRVRSACARASRAGVTNVRVLRVEISYAVKYLLPANSTASAHLLFPDPWPKQRHQRRRIVTRDFIAAVHRLLVLDGFFHIATDQADYFASICELVKNSGFSAASTEDRSDLPLTTFQKRFLAAGAPIYRLTLRKTV